MFKLLEISQIKYSTHTIHWPKKQAKKVTWAIYRPDEKKLRKYWKVGISLSINDHTKIPQIYTLPQFLSILEKIVEFFDLTHSIYWPTNIAKKVANCWKKSLYICQY